jgi:integrase
MPTARLGTAVIGVLVHSPAEHVRRPAVPPESPTLGFTHLQFEAMLSASRESPNPNDFALVAMLGLLGLRIFEATGADISDLGEEHGHRILRVCGRAPRLCSCRCRPQSGVRSTARLAPDPPGRSCSTTAESGWTGTRRRGA